MKANDNIARVRKKNITELEKGISWTVHRASMLAGSLNKMENKEIVFTLDNSQIKILSAKPLVKPHLF